MFRHILLLASIAVAAPAFGAPARPVSLKDPATFAATLREMGYAVGAKATPSGSPQLITEIGGLQTSILLLGCTNGKACSHIFMSSTYEDVPNPPDAWITEMNDNFDILKISKSNDKTLFFSAAHFVEGLPRSTFKRIMDAWGSDTGALADKAREAGLVKE
jgi:hypothetical protein